MQISIAVQRMSLPSCSKLFHATRPKGRFSVNAAKYQTVSEQSGTALPIQQGWYARASSDKELIKRWSRIRVRQPRYCILKITASSLRSRLRKLWRATIGITPARQPRLLPQRRKKSPRAKNHGRPGFLAARVYRERIIDRVCGASVGGRFRTWCTSQPSTPAVSVGSAAHQARPGASET